MGGAAGAEPEVPRRPLRCAPPLSVSCSFLSPWAVSGWQAPLCEWERSPPLCFRNQIGCFFLTFRDVSCGGKSSSRAEFEGRADPTPDRDVQATWHGPSVAGSPSPKDAGRHISGPSSPQHPRVSHTELFRYSRPAQTNAIFFPASGKSRTSHASWDLTGLTSPGIVCTFEANNPAHFLQQVHGIRRWSPTPGTAGSGPPPASPTRPTGVPGPRGRSPTPTTSRTRTRLPAWSPFMGVDQWRRVLGLCQPGEPFDMTSRSGVRSGIAEEYTIYVTYYFLGIVAFMTTRVVPLDFDSVLMPCCNSRISKKNAK